MAIGLRTRPGNQGRSLTMAMISDTGGPLASGTTFFYNFGEIGKANNFSPTNSFGPGPDAVSKLVQSWKPEHLIAVGDLAYNVGASTLHDASIGQYYNNLIHPYPSPAYFKGPYLSINGKRVARGQKAWPYNIYNFPNGFPNPVSPQRQGGSPTGRNRFWASLGNHDYGQEVGYGQPGVTRYNYSGEPTGTPIGPSSTSSLQASIDYYLPFLDNPNLLGSDKNRLNIGRVDKTGNSGAYYSIKLGGTAIRPLIEVFQLDSERLNVNAGYENWNTAQQGGLKRRTQDDKGKVRYINEIDESPNLAYDPSLPYNASDPKTIPLKGTTQDLNNGYNQYQWLRQSLEKSKAKWKIITGHHPTYASGRWADTQPDSHMSNPWMQRLLKALPPGSFDAYYNGENHFYERILETKPGGIGLGIPFIGGGNSGRNLERKIQIPYGGSVYNPPAGSFLESKTNPDHPYENPNTKAINALLDSDPVIAGTSGLAGTPDSDNRNFANGLYGYGFGAVKVDADDDYMLFNYQETPVVDPAIANHLKSGQAPESGFRETSASDWIPQTNGSFSADRDLARFKLSITDGVVKAVTLVAAGNGYMGSKNGNYVVKGFNVYGNNVDISKPWLKTAQVDLTFSQGKLSDVKLTDGGQGYELAVKAALENNDATTTDGITNPDQQLMVGLNYNIDETQYGVRDPSLYNDWHMITDTQASVKLQGTPGRAGILEVQMLAKSDKARQLLSGGLKPTTGYSGSGAQSFSSAAQSGSFKLYDRQQLIASGNLSNGIWRGTLDKLPSRLSNLSYIFDGDPISSYNVNFKPSSGSVRASLRPLLGAAADTRLQTRTPLSASAGGSARGVNRLAESRPLAASALSTLTVNPLSNERASLNTSPWGQALIASPSPL